MADPIEVLLKFAFLAVLYLFLLWVARSALRGPAPPVPRRRLPGRRATVRSDGPPAPARRARLIVEQGGGGLRAGESFVIGSGITIGRAPAQRDADRRQLRLRPPRARLRVTTASCLPRGHELDQRHLPERPARVDARRSCCTPTTGSGSATPSFGYERAIWTGWSSRC